MSTIIKAKRSSVQGKVPLTTDLELGEFAINTFDGKLYIKKNVNGTESIVDITSGGASASYVTDQVVLSTTTANQVVDSFALTAVRTVKYYVEAATSSSYHATEILLTHDGTDCYVTEYATIFSGSSLISFNANISSGNVRLLATPVNANTTVTFARIDVLEGGAVGGGGSTYTLPTANTTVLGGVKVDGTTITVANGVISSAGGGITAGDYVVRAVKNGTGQTITNGTDTVVTFVDDFDPQNWFASNRFQPTIAGYYSLTAQIWWGAGTINNNQTNLQLRKNGSTQLAITQTPVNNSTVGEFLNLSTIAYFNGTTDYVEVTAYTANPTSQTINGSAAGTWFTAALYAYGSAAGSSSFSNEYVLTGTTTANTETEILVGGSTRIPVPTNKSVNYIVNIAARRTDTPGDYAMFELQGIAANSNGAVTDIGSVYEVIVARTNTGYLVDARADDTNNTINIYVTGVTGHTISWKASAQIIEV